MTRKTLKKVVKTLEECDTISKTRKNRTSNAKALKCSRENVAIDLLKEKTQGEKKRKNHLGKCKMKESAKGVILPYYQCYLAIQIRNALVTHNWEAAAQLLRILLKNSKTKLTRLIWRAFFLIIQHLPEDIGMRMERLQAMCSKVLKDKDFLMAITIPEDK